ncbi:protein CREG1 isoform X2 [Pseudophryne corroboree]|uniref:protein CREG1 isoform X1 n=1 Tax=Pseudophryne corroboree TaxID=495146 RepID=UPI003081B458
MVSRRSGVSVCCAVSAALLVLLLQPLPGAPSPHIPPYNETARVARYVAHHCDWGSLATISSHDPVRGQPFANVFSVSDGPRGHSSGVIYFYLTAMEISVQDLQVNSQASLTMSLAQTPYCRLHHYDPESPLCAHIIVSGSVVKVDDKETDTAKLALFTRHPEMSSWPRDHDWFFAKLNITNIWVLDYFGGIKTVTPDEYYKARP